MDNNLINLNMKAITSFSNYFNTSHFHWTPIEEIYSIEIICGLKRLKDQSYPGLVFSIRRLSNMKNIYFTFINRILDINISIYQIILNVLHYLF